MATSTGADLINLLLGLAWLGELDRRQIQRLCFADKSESTVEKTLTGLHKEGLLARRSWSIRDEQRGVTVPQLARWSLAPAGHKEVKASDQHPAKPAQVRQQRLIPHDARTTEAIVRLIEVGRRSRLSGIYVARELRLNPQESRPVCDALVVVQFGSFDRPNLVPWSSDPAIEDEGRLRFAVEADNDTEPLGVIAGKAHAYRKLAEDDTWAAWWTQQHGPLPIPLWVAPSEERALAIHRQWKRAWPKGKWLVTSDVGLRQNELLQWSRQEEERVVLRFSKGRIALPATEPPPPIPPTQAHSPAPPAQPPPKQELIAASAAPPALTVAAPPAALAVSTPAHPPVAAPATTEPPRSAPAPQTLLPAPTKEEYRASRGRLQAARR